MSHDAWARVDRIFTEARAVSPDTRAAFVDEACGTDDALRRDVLALLAAEDRAGSFMERPALDSLADVIAAEGWRLQPGERIGAYTVLRLLGSGGAGEVWRARDERLGRDVAIKVLLPHYSADSERLRRFADEARTAGALNHSNILTVYDVGEHRGIPYLVSECLDGQSLRQRIEAGPFRADEVVVLALGLANGLAAAHARGIIHRDLKPENTFIRADGVVKILDFGLAKLQSSLEAVHAPPTHTVTGVIVGTAGYMSPEQVRGDAVDARSDLFSVGVMLYEMLTGRHPFRGASTFETLHAVLTADPPDLPERGVPPALAGIAMRLLSKSPEARFQTALDLVWALEQVPGRSGSVERRSIAAPAARAPRIARASWLVLAATGVVLFAAWSFMSRPISAPAEPPLAQLTLALPPDTVLQSPPAVSPDGRHIAFTARDRTGSRLYVRTLASRDAVQVPGTDGAQHPFWSPDGQALGFFVRIRGQSEARLVTAPWPGGAPVAIATAPFPLGGAWSRSGTILFGRDVILSGLFRVPAAGGEMQAATTVDLQRGDNAHGWPAFLPDGVHYLYYVRSADDARRGVYLGRLDRPSSEPGSQLFQSESDAIYVTLPDGGAVLSVADGRIAVRRFDPSRGALSGDARTLDLPAGGSSLVHRVMLGASPDVLAFATGILPYGARLEVVDRGGRRQRLWDAAEPQNWPRVSRDGMRLARQRVDWSTNNPDIWVEDLERGTRVRVTTAVEPDCQAVWSPDGRRLAYVSGTLPGRSGKAMVSIAAADGSGLLRGFPCPSGYCEPTDWSADGRTLLLNVSTAQGSDVWTMSADDGTARPVLNGAFDERDARLSPDGRWIAYVSRESGRAEVSVRAVAGDPERTVVSAAGGDQPVWRRDGGELFFVGPDGQLNSAPVTWRRDAAPRFGLPTVLSVPRVGFGHWGTQYDVSPDGSRIYLMRPVDDPPPRDIHVVFGWRRLLEARYSPLGSGSAL